MNKIVYSFWTGAIKKRWKKYEKKLDLADIYQSSLNCLYLSVLYAKKWGFEVEVFTDLDSEYFIRKLPVDQVFTELNFLTYEDFSWIDGKIYAISRQKKPFVYIDWDVILMKSDIAEMIRSFKSDVLFQSLDRISYEQVKSVANELIYPDLNRFKRFLDLSPYLIEEFHRSHESLCNTSVLGFNNLSVRDTYIEEYMKCRNVAETMKTDDYSKILDQYLLYCILISRKASYEVLLDNYKDLQKQAMGIGYTHLTFLSKYHKKTQEKVIQRIKTNFSEYQFLVENKSASANQKKISLCTVVMNRMDHLVTTLKHNLEVIRRFEGAIDINIIDYNSTDGLQDFLFEQDWFLSGLKEGYIFYYKNYEATVYHRTLPKNAIHYLSKGEFLINIDADNFISYVYLKYCFSLIRNQTNFFARSAYKNDSGAFGRIMVRKEDFDKIGGYNLKIETYGYEDTELTLRLRKLGVRQELIPSHLCLDVIEHGNELRTINEKKIEKFRFDDKIADSDYRNKNLEFDLYPNKGLKYSLDVTQFTFSEKIPLKYNNEFDELLVGPMSD